MTGHYRILRERSVCTDVEVTNHVAITDLWVHGNGNFVPIMEQKGSVNRRIKNQLDATYYFIVLLKSSTYFRHYCDHHHVVINILLWEGDVGRIGKSEMHSDP